MIGQLLDRTEQADAYVQHYRSVVDMVRSRLEDSNEPPTPTFFWRAPGFFECCSTFSKANLAQLVTYAGGKNVADDVLGVEQGSLAPEAVVKANPTVIIGTGANWAPRSSSPSNVIPLGYLQSKETARSALDSMVKGQKGFEEIDAVKSGRVYAVWHHFYDTPFNYLAIAWFAKWMHPDLFADIDADAMFAELHDQFLPVAASGTFWTQL